MSDRFEGKIFQLDSNGSLSFSTEEPFAEEKDLERLIARHPDLLPGDQINPQSPRRWLLIGSQVPVPGDLTKWKLDLLFVDQEGIPTLVELKKGSNPELRRRVVGQMLDYAANAPIIWPTGALRSLLEMRAKRESADPAAILSSFLSKEARPEEFWEQVDSNLKARRIRLLFVTDRMVPELRRVVEFLNLSMGEVEVLAVEIRRYTGAGPSALVPTVYGQTLASEEKRASGAGKGPAWTAERFFPAMEAAKGPEACNIARELLAWSEKNASNTWWGFRRREGTFFPEFEIQGEKYYPFGVWTDGKVEILFEELMKHAPFAAEPACTAFRKQLSDILGTDLAREPIDSRPRFPIDALARAEVRERFLVEISKATSLIRQAADLEPTS